MRDNLEIIDETISIIERIIDENDSYGKSILTDRAINALYRAIESLQKERGDL